jgi:hypothetical protein
MEGPFVLHPPAPCHPTVLSLAPSIDLSRGLPLSLTHTHTHTKTRRYRHTDTETQAHTDTQTRTLRVSDPCLRAEVPGRTIFVMPHENATFAVQANFENGAQKWPWIGASATCGLQWRWVFVRSADSTKLDIASVLTLTPSLRLSQLRSPLHRRAHGSRAARRASAADGSKPDAAHVLGPRR